MATSLIQAESKDKHCFLLQVHKTMFKIQAVRLNDIRPFVFDHVELSKSQTENGISLDARNMTQIEEFLIKRIERLLG